MLCVQHPLSTVIKLWFHHPRKQKIKNERLGGGGYDAIRNVMQCEDGRRAKGWEEEERKEEEGVRGRAKGSELCEGGERTKEKWAQCVT